MFNGYLSDTQYTNTSVLNSSPLNINRNLFIVNEYDTTRILSQKFFTLVLRLELVNIGFTEGTIRYIKRKLKNKHKQEWELLPDGVYPAFVISDAVYIQVIEKRRNIFKTQDKFLNKREKIIKKKISYFNIIDNFLKKIYEARKVDDFLSVKKQALDIYKVIEKTYIKLEKLQIDPVETIINIMDCIKNNKQSNLCEN